eukprot:g1909.t1
MQPHTGQPACAQCHEGQFNHAHGAKACRTCPDGYQQQRLGQTLCTRINCHPGRYFATADTTPKDQRKVREGTPTHADGCSACSKGRYQPGRGAVFACTKCPDEYYQGRTGQSSCVNEVCKPGTVFNGTGCLPVGRVCQLLQLSVPEKATIAWEHIECSGVYKLRPGAYSLTDDDGYTKDSNIQRADYSRVPTPPLATMRNMSMPTQPISARHGAIPVLSHSLSAALSAALGVSGGGLGAAGNGMELPRGAKTRSSHAHAAAAAATAADALSLEWDQAYAAWQVSRKPHTSPFLLSATSHSFTPFGVSPDQWKVHRNGALVPITTSGMSVRCISEKLAEQLLLQQWQRTLNVGSNPTHKPTEHPTKEPTLFPTAYPTPGATNGAPITGNSASATTAARSSTTSAAAGNADAATAHPLSNVALATVWIALAILVNTCGLLLKQCCGLLKSILSGSTEGQNAPSKPSSSTAEEAMPMMTHAPYANHGGTAVEGEAEWAQEAYYSQSQLAEPDGNLQVQVAEDEEFGEEEAMQRRAKEQAKKIFDQIMV